jgi:hypothetical protein
MLRMAVDRLSNTVVINKANPAYAPSQSELPSAAPGPWGRAVADGTLSDDLILPIIHELTHHSSLQTPVGRSLGTLAVSHTAAPYLIIADADKLTGPARDLIRLAIANAFFTPLLEGIALFAESTRYPATSP